MFDYKEIERTIKDNHLPFQEIGDVDKEILIQRLYDTFVIGNPRALWLSFMELYSITDHDDLLYIDVRKNKMKVDNV